MVGCRDRNIIAKRLHRQIRLLLTIKIPPFYNGI